MSDIDEILDVLAGVIQQACSDRDGTRLDSMALTSYADGLRLLEKHGRVVIEAEYGRRVIARWAQEESDGLDDLPGMWEKADLVGGETDER